MTLYLDAQSEKYASAICYGLFDSCKDDFEQEDYRVISLPEFFDLMTKPEIHFTDADFSSPFSPYREFSTQVAEKLHMRNKKIPFIVQNSYFTREGFVFMPGINPQIFLINDSSLFTYRRNHQEELQIDDLGKIQPSLNLEGNLIFPIKEIDPVIRKCIFGEKQGLEETLEKWGTDTIKLCVCDKDYINHVNCIFLRHNLFSKIVDNEIILKAATDITAWTRGIKKI